MRPRSLDSRVEEPGAADARSRSLGVPGQATDGLFFVSVDTAVTSRLAEPLCPSAREIIGSCTDPAIGDGVDGPSGEPPPAGGWNRGFARPGFDGSETPVSTDSSTDLTVGADDCQCVRGSDSSAGRSIHSLSKRSPTKVLAVRCSERSDRCPSVEDVCSHASSISGVLVGRTFGRLARHDSTTGLPKPAHDDRGQLDGPVSCRKDLIL